MARLKVTDGQIEGALRQTSGIKSAAADLLKVDRTTIQARVDRSPRLQQAIKDIRERVVDKAEGVVMDALNKKDKQTARWALERLGKDRGYATKIENENRLADDQLETLAIALGGDPEKLRALRNSLDPSGSTKP